MSLNHVPPVKWRAAALASALALLSSTMPLSAQSGPAAVVRSSTKTPIQHVIVIIGENRTFDHIFATYKPVAKRTPSTTCYPRGSFVRTDLPVPTTRWRPQFSAVDTANDGYQISPGGKSLYSNLPPPLAGGPTTPYFKSLVQAEEAENGLALSYYQYMFTGGTGLTRGTTSTPAFPTCSTCRRARSNSPPAPIPTTRTPTAQCTAFTRCGSSWIATPTTPPSPIPVAAMPTCFPGLK